MHMLLLPLLLLLQSQQIDFIPPVSSSALTRYISCPAKTLSNTSSTVQPVATITTTNDTGGLVFGFFSSVAQSATAINVDSVRATVLWRNIGGTATAATSTGVDISGLDSSGTLTTAVTSTFATNVVTINFTPAWTTIVPTLVTGRVDLIVHGVDSAVCVP